MNLTLPYLLRLLTFRRRLVGWRVRRSGCRLRQWEWWLRRLGLLKEDKAGGTVGDGQRHGQLVAVEKGFEQIGSGRHITEGKGFNILVI